MSWRVLFVSLLPLLQVATCYDIVREYSGQTFFDRWDFYGSWDNLTLGDVWWQDRNTATQQRLAYIDNNGRAVMRADNTTTVANNYKRDSVRITSQDSYGVGSLWVADITHLPWGCSVWPAFWTKGPTWPDNGEIDIIEAVNLMGNNQYALHTTPGCVFTQGAVQTGRQQGTTDCSQGSGCVVAETKPNSFNAGFNDAGGGVWATQFDVEGIFIWFWSRADVPASITQATSTSSIDISSWGPPSASYPSAGCNIPQYFTAQNLVFDITLCGNWAGVPSIYQPACGKSGPTGLCYNDNVVGAGSPKYDEAYFEVNYVRAYTTAPNPTPTPAASAVSASATAAGISVPSAAAQPDTTSVNGNSSGAQGLRLGLWDLGLFAVSTVGLATLRLSGFELC